MTLAAAARISVTPAPVSQSPDHDLMVAVAAGDLGSMSQIYEHRHRPLFQFFFRLTGRQAASEDLVHEVFLRMIRYRHTYQTGNGFEAWMYRIARNVLTDAAKKLRHETAAGDGELEGIPAGDPDALDIIVRREDLALLQRALRELPEDKRELLVLSRFQGLSYAEIGRIVGCETGAVKVRVFRAMKAMGQIFLALRKETTS